MHCITPFVLMPMTAVPSSADAAKSANAENALRVSVSTTQTAFLSNTRRPLMRRRAASNCRSALLPHYRRPAHNAPQSLRCRQTNRRRAVVVHGGDRRPLQRLHTHSASHWGRKIGSSRRCRRRSACTGTSFFATRPIHSRRIGNVKTRILRDLRPCRPQYRMHAASSEVLFVSCSLLCRSSH